MDVCPRRTFSQPSSRRATMPCFSAVEAISALDDRLGTQSSPVRGADGGAPRQPWAEVR